MKIDKISKAQLALCGVSLLSLLQVALTETYYIPLLVMVACYCAHVALVNVEKEMQRKKYLLRKYQKQA